MEDRAQRLGRPRQLLFVARSLLGFEVADQRAQVAGDGLQLRGVGQVRGPPQTLAPQQGLQSLHPTPPAQLRHHDRDERDRAPETDEEEEQVLARFLAAAHHEAHVVHQGQLPCRHSPPDCQRADRHEERAVRALEQPPRGAP